MGFGNEDSKTVNDIIPVLIILEYSLAFDSIYNDMMQSGGGKVINITSRGAFRGEPDAPAYGAAKVGLNAP